MQPNRTARKVTGGEARFSLDRSDL